jgi:hypothetical protein
MAHNGLIDLYSDTQTRPSAGMRRAMAEAEVGDEQRAEDPSTLRLQERVAELLGKEAAVFLPSGTMCRIAIGCTGMVTRCGPPDGAPIHTRPAAGRCRVSCARSTVRGSIDRGRHGRRFPRPLLPGPRSG